MSDLEKFLERMESEVKGYPKGSGTTLYYLDDVRNLIAICKLQREALEEIDWMFDGEADIDDHGKPNRAMEINNIVSSANTKSNAIASEKGA